MTEKLIYALHSYLKKDVISLFYLGEFSGRSLLALTDIIDASDKNRGNFGRLKFKTIYLIIESFQNIVRYSKDAKVGNFFMVRKLDDNVFISTANTVSEERVILLKDKIDEINKLDTKALKEKYKKIIVNKEFSEEGGAGLGLVDMSRKTKQKIDYHFEKFGEKDFSFYILIKYLSGYCPKLIEVLEVKDFYSFLSVNNILVLFKHEFNEDINEAILRTCEINITSNNKRQKKLVYHLSVEILQNISIHAFEVDGKKEGVFYMIKQGNSYIINTGNFIHNYDIYDFNKFLKILKTTPKEKLDKLYKEQLIAEDFDGNGGLGFIDIAREADEFTYNFFEINEDYSFFTFSFKI